jgi:hypothetical protein
MDAEGVEVPKHQRPPDERWDWMEMKQLLENGLLALPRIIALFTRCAISKTSVEQDLRRDWRLRRRIEAAAR